MLLIVCEYMTYSVYMCVYLSIFSENQMLHEDVLQTLLQARY